MTSLIRRLVISAPIALALGTIVLQPHALSAGPPFVTDDPMPTDVRQWEIYAGLQYENEANAAVLVGAPFLALNYGALPNVQVSVSSAAGNDGSMPADRFGNGGTQFGIKLRFAQETNRWPAIAVYPSVAFPTSAGNHAATFLPLWLQKSVGLWTAFGGGGVVFNRGPGQRDYTLVGAALEHEFKPAALTVGAEFYHQSASAIGGSDTTAANIGAIAQVGARHAILLSAGRGLHGNDTLSTYGSYEFELGPK